ncbi:MAG: PAS domain-containing protein [Gallionella sp.]|nr:PAS domain-containing protein [Gallionella sp.]
MNPETWRYIFDAIDAPIFLHDHEYHVLLANRAYCRAARVAEAEALGKPYYEVFPRGPGPLPGCRDTLANGHVGKEEEVSVGEKRFLSTGYAVRDDQGKLLYALHIFSDITEQRQAEAALRRSEAETRLLLDTLPQKIFYKNQDSVYVSCNAAYARDLGIAAAEIKGRSDLDFYPKELAEKYRTDDHRLMATCKPEDIEEVYLKDGQECWVHTVKTPTCGETGEPTGILGIFWDVTALRQAQDRLVRLNRMYRTISLCNQALVRSEDELALANTMCEVLVEAGGYRGTCVMYGASAANAVTVACAGFSVEETRLVLEVGQRKAEEIDRLYLRQSLPDVRHDLSREAPVFAEAGARLGVASTAVIPLVVNGTLLGVLWVGSKEAGAFDDETVALLMEMAGDLSFGIGNLRARAERLGILEKLELSLDHAVTAIAATVEMRDPYTAGHQRRVALLAAAIAKEMELPEQQVEGLRMAGVVHDIGKIHVPAEILSNPSKLTAAEFEIIKTHPLAGYDILKGIDFPWPVAEIVYQHHEKLDGSGYPRGLKGEEILLEARILTVADVVEAMASHRPYRPGFGIFPALQEIARNRGKFYDERVTGACLRLFMEKNYEL